MKLKSQAGVGGFGNAGRLAPAGTGGRKSGEISAGPMRPPESDSQPSTLDAKNGAHTIRLEVMPPWLWPASQKDLMFSRPKAPTTSSTMFRRYPSSASATQIRVGGMPGNIELMLAAVGVAITSLYFSL